MRRPYRTIGDVLRSPWAGLIPKEETPPQQNDRVLHSTKLEDRIYADLRNGDPAMDALEQARREIDTVDAQLATLFERRMKAVLSVAEYKKAHGLPIFDAAREKVVLDKAEARIGDPALKSEAKRS